jgi:hypothetical protein
MRAEAEQAVFGPFTHALEDEASRAMWRLSAVRGHVNSEQRDELASVVRDGTEERAFVAAVVAGPAQQSRVLRAQRQTPRLGEIDKSRRVLDGRSALVELGDVGHRLHIGELVLRLIFARSEISRAGMARKPGARPFDGIGVGIEVLDQPHWAASVGSRAVVGEVVILPISIDAQRAPGAEAPDAGAVVAGAGTGLSGYGEPPAAQTNIVFNG